MKKQFSPKFADNLANGINIKSTQDICLLKIALDAIIELGHYEHDDDWDPFLIIEMKDGTKHETYTGYPEIIFGDLNEEEQDENTLKNQKEITSIGFHIDPNPNDSDYARQENITFLKFRDIKRISLAR